MTETLTHCVCGECFYCPDGWHGEDELPCDCTPDCLLGDDGPCPECGLHSLVQSDDGQWTCRACGADVDGPDTSDPLAGLAELFGA